MHPLSLLVMMFALTPCANQYKTNPIVFINFNGALKNIITLDLTKGFSFPTKYINIP
jgi:hypothetical protein